MDKIRTLMNTISLDLILLIAILALLIITVIFLLEREFLIRHRIAKWIESKKHRHHRHNRVEQSSDIEKFLKILPNLPKELEILQSYKSKADNFDELEENFENVNKKKQTLTEQIAKLEDKISDNQTKIQEKEKLISDKLIEIKEQNKTYKELLEKIKKAEILRDYAGKVSDYFYFCDNILKNTNEKKGKSDLETVKIMSALLQQALHKTTEIAKWKQICSDINEKGVAIQNKDIKNCFQSDNEAEQLDAFKTMCISKIKPVTNAILILCEANGNLSRFVENSNVSSIENEFINMISEVKNKAKEIGIVEIDQVKLFTPLGNNLAINGKISFPYMVVKNLKKDEIIEIVEFGMKTEFEEQTKTKVLIN